MRSCRSEYSSSISLALETGEALETEVENRLRLDLGELEALLQAGARFIGVGRPADERDDLVEVVEGGEIALEDVGALLRLAEARTWSAA